MIGDILGWLWDALTACVLLSDDEQGSRFMNRAIAILKILLMIVLVVGVGLIIYGVFL